MAESATAAPAGVNVTRAPESVTLPQLRPTQKGTLEPKTVGRPILKDLVLGVNLLIDMSYVAETNVIGIKIFAHKEKTESYHLAEVYVLGGAVGGDMSFLGSLLLCRLDYPDGVYSDQHDDQVVAAVREMLLPGPKAYQPAKT